MTSYNVIYDAFLAKIEEDDWANNTDLTELCKDWESLLEAALPWFKFPKHSMKRVGTTYPSGGQPVVGYFESDLDAQEVQIIATLMKWMWLDRTIHTWENVKAMYDDRDFSQANLLNNFIKLLEYTKDESEKMQKLYSRVKEDADGYRSPYSFRKLAGKNGIK